MPKKFCWIIVTNYGLLKVGKNKEVSGYLFPFLRKESTLIGDGSEYLHVPPIIPVILVLEIIRQPEIKILFDGLVAHPNCR